MIVVVVIVAGVIWWGRSRPAQVEPMEAPAPATIGGNRDEHGCLGPAGYGWSEEVGACVREWELDESARRAARLAVDHIGQKEGLTVVEVLPIKCPGCFRVMLDVFQEKIQVDLKNWEVSISE